MSRDVEKTSSHAPHLSHSRINRYLTCPRQYELYYVKGLRPRHPPANLVFGKTIHAALAALFSNGSDLVEHFTEGWQSARDVTLTYSGRTTWESLRATGTGLLDLFSAKALSRIGQVDAVEQRFELGITGLDLPFVGIVDLVAEVDGKKTLVDFKTAASRYNAHEVELSDQLTAYQMAEPDAEQTALCVLVKTKEPKITWLVSRRNGARLTEYLDKARLVARSIKAGHFYQRPGMWCTWCDYLPVCTGDQKKAAATLIQIETGDATARTTSP